MKRFIFQLCRLLFLKIAQAVLLKKHSGMVCSVFSTLAKKCLILLRQLFDLLSADIFLP